MYLDEKASDIDLRSNSLSVKFPTHSCLSEWIFFCIGTWSSGQNFWLQIQSPGFDPRRYQIFWVVVGLERGPLSLVSLVRSIEELLEWKK